MIVTAAAMRDKRIPWHEEDENAGIEMNCQLRGSTKENERKKTTKFRLKFVFIFNSIDLDAFLIEEEPLRTLVGQKISEGGLPYARFLYKNKA